MEEIRFAHSERMLVMKEASASVVKVIRHAAKFRSYSLPSGHACETQVILIILFLSSRFERKMIALFSFSDNSFQSQRLSKGSDG